MCCYLPQSLVTSIQTRDKLRKSPQNRHKQEFRQWRIALPCLPASGEDAQKVIYTFSSWQAYTLSQSGLRNHSCGIWHMMMIIHQITRTVSDLQSRPKPWTRLSYPSLGPQRYDAYTFLFHIRCPSSKLPPLPRVHIRIRPTNPENDTVCVVRSVFVRSFVPWFSLSTTMVSCSSSAFQFPSETQISLAHSYSYSYSYSYSRASKL